MISVNFLLRYYGVHLTFLRFRASLGSSSALDSKWPETREILSNRVKQLEIILVDSV